LKETQVQMTQLTALAGGNAANVFNFGVQGYNLLATIAHDLISSITAFPDPSCLQALTQTFAWCGFTSYGLCSESGPNACKWDYALGNCYYQGDCSFNQFQCDSMVRFFSFGRQPFLKRNKLTLMFRDTLQPGCTWNIKKGCVGG